MMRESMCDTCMSPGHCCRRVYLSGGPADNPINQPMSFERAEHMAMKIGVSMFRPAEQDENGIWSWWCTALQRDGRCSIYEDRPDLCRRYRPGQDGLCVHYWADPDPISALAAEVAALEGAPA